MKMTMKFILPFVLVLLLFSTFVSAFGVTSPYWDTKPLKLYPGETKEFPLILQNMVGDEDIILRASIFDNPELAVLLDENLDYQVPFGRKDILANVQVTLPENVPPGETHKVGVSFKQLVSGEGEMVKMGGGVKTYIPVVAVVQETIKSEQASTIPSSTFFFLLLITGMVIYVVLRKRREKSDGKRK